MNTVTGHDAVVHLAGESIGGRWTRAKKDRILSSRVSGTSLLARSVVEGEVPVLVSGSAIGFYGDRGDEELDERSSLGSGFLAEVVSRWEGSTAAAVDGGVRTVLARTSLVLDGGGGSFPRMMLPFRLGVGGRIGSGRQWWSWISLADVVAALIHCLEVPELSGPVNLVAPDPIRNADFVKALGQAMRRPALMPAPARGLRLLLGAEFADQVLLASQRVMPTQLLRTGFHWSHPDVASGLAAAVG